MPSILGGINIVPAIAPVDLSAAANNGRWISLKNYGRLLIVMFKAIGTAGQDPIFTVQQATKVDGTGVKALNFTKIFKKQAADVTGVGAWTEVNQAAANTYVDDTNAELQNVTAVEILPEDLDVNNGFDCVRLTIPDVGAAAMLGCAFYILTEPRISNNQSPLAD